MQLNPAKKPQEIEYHLRCKVVAKEVTYLDEQSKGTTQVTEKLVFLIPQANDQRSKFFFAWLPDTDLDPAEVVCEIGHPLFAIFRAALWRRTQHVNDFHLFVMTKSTEEMLKPMHDKTVDVTILPCTDEAKADGQRDWKLPYNKNKNKEDGMVRPQFDEE